MHIGFGLGLRDKTGREIKCGDTVLHLNEGAHTKTEYWYARYKIVWDAPCFVAVHCGGGKPTDISFKLKYHPSELVILNSEDN